MTGEHFWLAFVLVGFAGFGIGGGLVVGAFVARALRRYMRDEGLGNGGGRRGEHDPRGQDGR